MTFKDLIEKRRSVRAFEDRAIESEKLQAILEMVNQAPSAGNLQAFEIYKVTAPRTRAAIARAANQSFIAEAPVVLVFFANPGRSALKYGTRGRDLFSPQDAAIAAAYTQLAATDLGLASVWIGSFKESDVSLAVRAPGDWVPVAILPVGYGAEMPAPRPRRGVADLVHDVD
jgi:nitroreductase